MSERPPGVPATRICVQVVCAAPEHAIQKNLHLNASSNVLDALREAARDAAFGGVDLLNAAVGIFGIPVRREQVLNDGDRIEIYRRLTADPKTARRARAKEASKSARS